MEQNKNFSKPLIQEIWQKDFNTFSIKWVDGLIHDYNLGKLQVYCPCAACHQVKDKQAHEQLSAYRIHNVGRYALRIHFKKGCSMGIYDYSFLYELASKDQA